uniref:Ig-like domain-containing protein n=1 Tax=Macrostomum lignano TaxID=282301 RepID=A0A1I8FMH0_9PLAT
VKAENSSAARRPPSSCTWSRWPQGQPGAAERTPRPRKSPSPLPELWKEPDRPAKVTFPLRNRFSFSEGGFVKLSCTFDGLPPPEVFWKRRSPSCSRGARITTCSTQDSGRYSVGLKNAKGEDETQVQAGRAAWRQGVRFKESMSVDRLSETYSRSQRSGAGGGSSTIVEEKYSLEFEFHIDQFNVAARRCAQSTSATSVSRASERSSRQKETDGDIHRRRPPKRPRGHKEAASSPDSQGGRPGRAELHLQRPLPMTSASPGTWTASRRRPRGGRSRDPHSRAPRQASCCRRSGGGLRPVHLHCSASGASAKTFCRLTVEAPKAQAAQQVKIDAHPRSLSVKDGEPFELAGLKRPAGPWSAFPDDSGQYRAELLARDSAVAAVASAPFGGPRADEPDAPSELLETFRSRRRSMAGAAVTVACKAKLPGLTATWTKENGTATGQLSNDGDRLRLVSADCDHSLNIAAAAATDSGLYRIDLTGPDGAKETACFSLQRVGSEWIFSETRYPV